MSPAAVYCARCRGEIAAHQEPLTKRQAEILAVVTTFIASNGYAPSHVEIAVTAGLRSLASVNEHLHTLERKGYLARRYNESRAIALVEAVP